MIAPRVQPIGTLPDNEPGRCSSWIASRQPSHASFYDDDPPTLPSCRFARAQIQQPLPVNDYRSLNPCAERSYHDRCRDSTFETLPYQASLPCAEPSASIEQLQSQLQPQCSQFRDCAQNLVHGGAKSCQLGPVDVEDLALYFEPDKLPSINCLPRVYRPSSSSSSSSDSSNFRRAKSTRYGPYPSLANGKRLERSRFSPSVNWLDEREFRESSTVRFLLYRGTMAPVSSERPLPSVRHRLFVWAKCCATVPDRGPAKRVPIRIRRGRAATRKLFVSARFTGQRGFKVSVFFFFFNCSYWIALIGSLLQDKHIRVSLYNWDCEYATNIYCIMISSIAVRSDNVDRMN